MVISCILCVLGFILDLCGWYDNLQYLMGVCSVPGPHQFSICWFHSMKLFRITGQSLVYAELISVLGSALATGALRTQVIRVLLGLIQRVQ